MWTEKKDVSPTTVTSKNNSFDPIVPDLKDSVKFYRIAEGTQANCSIWSNVSITWSDFKNKFSTPRRTKETVIEYQSFEKSEKNKAKDGPCYIGAHCKNGRRTNRAVSSRLILALDFDECEPNVFEKLGVVKWCCLMHSTHSHTPAKPKIRLLLPLLREVNLEEFNYLVRKIPVKLNLKKEVCHSCFKIAQFMYYPSCSSDAQYYFNEVKGEIFNPDDWLTSGWQQEGLKLREIFEGTGKAVSKEKEAKKKKLKDNCLGAKGPIGAFCRSYSISATIDTFLSDFYRKEKDGVYTWLEGKGVGGLKVLDDDTLCISYHGTDPAGGGQECNSFNLICTHLHGGDPVAASKWALDQPGVKEDTQLIEEQEEYKKQKNEVQWYKFNNSGAKKFIPYFLAEHIAKEHPYVSCSSGFFVYKEGVYKKRASAEMGRLISEHLDSTRKFAQVNEVKEQLKYKHTKIEDLNNTDKIINLRNCIIEINDKNEFKEQKHNVNYLTTIQCQANFSNDVTCANWLKFLDDVLPKEQQQIVQEIIGYLLISNNRAKRFFMLYGPGDCGKSVIIETIIKLIGKDNCSSLSLQQIGNPELRFVTSELFGKSVNIVGDLSAKRITDSGTIKMLTGDDLIRAEKKGGETFTFRNKARLLFSANRLPSCDDKTKAFYNRFLIIPFENVIPLEKQIRNLVDTFNIDGILNWALEGLKRLLTNNLVFSEFKANKEVLGQYKLVNNSVLAYANDCCEIKEGAKIFSASLYSCYRNYCTNCGIGPVSRNKFKDELMNMGGIREDTHIIIDGKRKRGYDGISLTPEAIEELNNMSIFNT